MKQINEREAVVVNNIERIAQGLEGAILVILMQLNDNKAYADLISGMSMSIVDNEEDRAELQKKLEPMIREYNDTVEKSVIALTRAISSLTMLGKKDRVVNIMELVNKRFKKKKGGDWTDSALSMQIKALDDAYEEELEKARKEE